MRSGPFDIRSTSACAHAGNSIAPVNETACVSAVLNRFASSKYHRTGRGPKMSIPTHSVLATVENVLSTGHKLRVSAIASEIARNRVRFMLVSIDPYLQKNVR